MDYLENYYSSYDEEGRLLSRHGQVEYLTTMKYIHAILGGDKKKKILEAGAGTGRYSVTLAKEGYSVDAVELTEHNLKILLGKLDGTENIRAVQGNALDLSRYEDNSFGVALVLGPMYHLCSEEDKKQALREAVRVTKTGGYILAAYCMNEMVVIKEVFLNGSLERCLERGMLTEDFHCVSKPEDLFEMVRVEDIFALTRDLPVTREKLIAADGATNYMRSYIDGLDDKMFDYWMKFHFATCERQDLIGATNHSLDILRKK